MKTINVLFFGIKYLKAHFRRYIFLSIAVGFGFAVITVATSLSDGMYKNVFEAARYHYGGDLFILGFDKQAGNMGLIDNDKAVMGAIKRSGITPDASVKRTHYFSDGVLFFAGSSSRQKDLFGVDYKEEERMFASMEWISGGGPLGDGEIYISEKVAEKLGARLGDDLVLLVNTVTGQKNTGMFIVKGIFRDTGIFGYYECFIPRSELNNLLGYKKEAYSRIGLYYNNLLKAEADSRLLYGELKKKLPASPFITDKETFTKEQDKGWNGVRYFVLTLNVFLSQVADLLKAIKLLSYFLYVTISAIILVSISVTYKLILRQRLTEIGTMRAIGVQKGGVASILLVEAGFIICISLLAGMVFSLLVLKGVSLLSFSRIQGFSVFLRGGRLHPFFKGGTVLLNISILLLITIPSILFPALRAAKMDLPKALSGDR